MNEHVHRLLKSVADHLPARSQEQLRVWAQKYYWERRDRSAVERRESELLLAPQFPQYSIGPHSVGKPAIPHNSDWGGLTVGDYCAIAEGVTILLGNEHGTGWVTTYPFNALWPQAKTLDLPQASKGDVVIGNDVWVGQDTLVLSGSSIGDGAVVGAGSVVRGKIPPYAIAVGNPCRTVMYRFKPEDIKVLQTIHWWEWPETLIGEALPLLLSDDIAGLEDFARERSLLQDEPPPEPPA